jgi:hypothetical protein
MSVSQEETGIRSVMRSGFQRGGRAVQPARRAHSDPSIADSESLRPRRGVLNELATELNLLDKAPVRS